MRTDIVLLKPGKLLFLALAFSLTSCRESTPPPIEICLLDGFGGGDCIERDGSRLYRVPSSMKNYWTTSEPDEAAFAGWCYDGTAVDAEVQMNAIKRSLR